MQLNSQKGKLLPQKHILSFFPFAYLLNWTLHDYTIHYFVLFYFNFSFLLWFYFLDSAGKRPWVQAVIFWKGQSDLLRCRICRRGDTYPFIESNEGNKMLYSQDRQFMHPLAKLIKLHSDALHVHPYHNREWLQLVFSTKSVCHCTNVTWFTLAFCH